MTATETSTTPTKNSRVLCSCLSGDHDVSSLNETIYGSDSIGWTVPSLSARSGIRPQRASESHGSDPACPLLATCEPVLWTPVPNPSGPDQALGMALARVDHIPLSGPVLMFPGPVVISPSPDDRLRTVHQPPLFARSRVGHHAPALAR